MVIYPLNSTLAEGSETLCHPSLLDQWYLYISELSQIIVEERTTNSNGAYHLLHFHNWTSNHPPVPSTAAEKLALLNDPLVKKFQALQIFAMINADFQQKFA